MRIEHVREFVALSHTLSFRRTADQLFLSQPTLSKHIAQMEDELGTPLFMRGRSHVQLTEQGRFFAKEMEALLRTYDRAVRQVQMIDPGGSLGIGMLYYSKEPMLPAIRRYRELFPSVALRFLSRTPVEIVDAVQNGSIDVGGILRVPFEGAEGLSFLDIKEEPLIAMVPAEHPLARRQSVHASELSRERYVHVNDRFYDGYLKHVRAEFARFGATVDSEPFLVRDVEEMLLSVEEGKGIAILSQNLSKQQSAFGTFLPIVEDVRIRRCLIYNTDNDNPALPGFIARFTGI